MKKTVNRLLGKFGYRIVKKETTHSLTSMLTRIASRAPLGIQTVIDVGASDGRMVKTGHAVLSQCQLSAHRSQYGASGGDNCFCQRTPQCPNGDGGGW